MQMCFNRSDLRIVGIKMRKNPIGKDNILEVCDVTLAFGGTVAAAIVLALKFIR